MTGVAAYVRKRFDQAVRHREKTGTDKELLNSLRAYNGVYDAEKRDMINQFGGSDIYARLTTQKCRGATALLRDIYLTGEGSWSLNPSPEPTLPEMVTKDIDMLVGAENLSMLQMGQQVDPTVLHGRRNQLIEAAMRAERVRAQQQSRMAGDRMDDILLEGRFYDAMSDFLSDLPIFQIAIIKGPVVRRVTKLRWKEGKAVQSEEVGFFWERVSPFDFWVTPGASSILHSETFERQRFTVQELYDLIGVPGYNETAIREVIEKFEAGGFKEWGTVFNRERERLEGRDTIDNDGFIDGIEFNGYVLGKYLKEFGLTAGIEDDLKPYFVTAWLIDKTIIKVMLNPNPRKRVPYYITSYDKKPGSIYGDGIPQLIADIQDVVNASARSLVNNMAMASGPQVGVNTDLLHPQQNTQMHPWKQWKFNLDPAAPNAVPIHFFQPQSNANELLGIYKAFSEMGDEVSAIPRYMTGDNKVGGAGRTASGLQMLMNNANKALQNVAQQIDEDVVTPLLEGLYDIIMLTDTTGMLRGDEQIVVNGIRRVAQQEANRVRQTEFLALTANPIDHQILGPKRAEVLQKVADGLGLDIDVPEPGEQAAAAPPVGPQGPSPNPGGGMTPDPSVGAGPPRLATQPQLNTISNRSNIA